MARATRASWWLLGALLAHLSATGCARLRNYFETSGQDAVRNNPSDAIRSQVNLNNFIHENTGLRDWRLDPPTGF
jgi:hypothetical protein